MEYRSGPFHIVAQQPGNKKLWLVQSWSLYPPILMKGCQVNGCFPLIWISNWIYLRWRKFSEYQNFFLYNTLKLVLKQGYYRTFVGSSSSSSPFLSASHSQYSLTFPLPLPSLFFSLVLSLYVIPLYSFKDSAP